MKREEIDNKYKWDLSTIYSSNEEYEKDFNQVKENIGKFKNYKEDFLNTPERFLEFMELYQNTNRKLEKLCMYSHLAIDVEPKNEYIQMLEANNSGLCDMYVNETVFVELEI